MLFDLRKYHFGRSMRRDILVSTSQPISCLGVSRWRKKVTPVMERPLFSLHPDALPSPTFLCNQGICIKEGVRSRSWSEGLIKTPFFGGFLPVFCPVSCFFTDNLCMKCLFCKKKWSHLTFSSRRSASYKVPPRFRPFPKTRFGPGTPKTGPNRVFASKTQQ